MATTGVTTGPIDTYFFIDTIIGNTCRSNIIEQIKRIVGISACDFPFVDDRSIKNGEQYLKITHDPAMASAESIKAQINLIKGPNWSSQNPSFHCAVISPKPSASIRIGI